MIQKIGFALLAIVAAITLAGCGSGDTDPHMKVDDPGYYNGPMKGGGGNRAPSGQTGQ